jgi:DNA end-binding protein Ku
MPRAGGIWKGSISFGLLNIPVSLHTAGEGRELHFHMLDSKDFAPIKYRKVNAATGKEVPYSRIVKGYEYEPDQYVVVTAADFAAANPAATQTIDIEDFVKLDEIDTMLFERPYYLLPQKNGEKGYFLLRDALAKTGKVAIGKIVIRTKQHLAAVMAKGDYLILELLRFAHEIKEVREVDFFSDTKTSGRYNPRELKMAEELIKGMSAKWKPDKYDDSYFDDLMKRIRQKVKQGKTHLIEEPEEEKRAAPAQAQVVDLLPLLRRSLAASKKGRGGKGKVKGQVKGKERHETAG